MNVLGEKINKSLRIVVFGAFFSSLNEKRSTDGGGMNGNVIK